MNKFVNEAAQAGRRLPTAKNEDVEYSSELADADDLEAVERAEQADARQGRK
ncbi:YfhD family protein [Paenibacillus sp. P26]|nr:YfhD family protein [Paenibacillus sp. P26]UUZ96160.1 YfhD family protein [Paenibacillus sp. P25]